MWDGLIVVLVVFGMIGVVIYYFQRGPKAAEIAAVEAVLLERPVRATLTQTVRMTTGGKVAWVLIALNNVAQLIIFMNERAVGAQIVTAVLWVASNQILVLGVMLGRRSTYEMRRGG